MRFIGNKELITEEIEKLLKDQGLVGKDLRFFDAFCGSGAVADYFKDYYEIIINDMIKWSVIYTKGRIYSKECNFSNLGFDPFLFLNSNEKILKGFFYNNYSPAASERMYFSSFNAGRIDFFRFQIEEWKKENLISFEEYAYLISSLIESISYVSNTAGVYGSFLKHWDPRAKKDIVFEAVISKNSKAFSVKAYNDKIENIIENVECDILYLDPPYTQNQYGTQYHILETLVLNDDPSISKITGSRPTSPMRSDWSKNYQSHILFDRVVSKTKAKYIVFSYSIDGFLSKKFIESILKRYGKPETYLCKELSYRKYTNFKSKSSKDHVEYIFFVEKKESNNIHYESPLNYTGNKFRLLPQIKHYFPKNISKFIDACGGGFNVGINSNADKVIYNDYNYFVRGLVESFKINNTYDYLMYINRVIKRFGLEKGNSESYIKARGYYNSLPIKKRDFRTLYSIILYGFNQQIRFNSNHEFNNPVGVRWFNDKVLEKFISFSREISEKNITFSSGCYSEYLDDLNKNDFVYLDPPYRFTTGSYNDGKRGFNGWCIEEEAKLFEYADKLNERSVRFMISYVAEHNNHKNVELLSWVERRGYRLIELEKILRNNRTEIIVINYDV